MKTYLSPLLWRHRLLSDLHVRNFKWSYRTIFSETGIWSEDLTIKTKFEIEKFWKKKMQDECVAAEATGKKTYVLSMFPYPSGKLHMGHIRVYSIGDALARYHRMLGKYVIHPIGWDSFGLPAENAARDRNEDPSKWTYNNIAYMKDQLKRFNCSFDWEREFATSDPSYYKWTQYIFLKMFEAGIAYQKLALVNWDPVDNTVLANEQIDENGRSWRSGAIVEKKLLKQWFLKTTKFSKALYEGLEDPSLKNWEEVSVLQKKWIGQCNGWNFDFPLELDGIRQDDWLTLWTPSPEFILGAAFIAITPDHYLNVCGKRIDKSNVNDFTEKLLQYNVINPFTNKSLPIIVTKNVSYTDGNNSRLGIPSINSEDIEVCKRFNLSYIDITDNSQETPRLKNSGKFNGMTIEIARKEICAHAENHQFGGYTSSSRLQDWLISRQRYWGTPIPIIHCPNCKLVPVPSEELPVVLPAFEKLSNHGSSPLQQMTEWMNVICPKCGTAATRETDTMDTFVDSSWYFLRYLDPHNQEKPFSEKLSKKFMPVDIYVGGIEHAILHLYLARFVSHFLHSQKLLHSPEPFHHLTTVGVVKGQTYVNDETGQYLSKDQVQVKGKKVIEKGTKLPVSVVWKKMSKSKFNGVDPDELFNEFGIDSTRLVLLKSGKASSPFNWSTTEFKGVNHWQHRVWFLVSEYHQSDIEKLDAKLVEFHNKEIYDIKNFTIKMVTQALNSSFSNHSGIQNLIGLTNVLRRLPREIVGSSLEYERAVEALIIMTAPYAPHFASELWAGFAASPKLFYEKNKSVWKQSWPEICMNFNMKISIQINGKSCTTIDIPRQKLESLNKNEIIEISAKEIADNLEGKKCVKIHCSHDFGEDAEVNFIIEKLKTQEMKLKQESSI